jgi:hypothetical protein
MCLCVIVECGIRIVKMWYLESDHNSHAWNDTAVETYFQHDKKWHVTNKPTSRRYDMLAYRLKKVKFAL